MIRNIQGFDNAAAIISEFMPEVMAALTIEEENAIRHFDDFESLEYFVIDERKVIVTDSLTGDVIQEFKNLIRFLRETLAYIEEEN